VRSAVRAVVGIAPGRTIPAFAPETFRSWFRRYRAARPADASGRPVILWPDTFNNHFHPDVLAAAVRALERLGWRVELPPVPLCCGRPLYDYGFLERARRLLAKIVRALHEPIAAGIPMVALEPSCAAVFRDELRGMLPGDEHARRLQEQTFTLGELLARSGASLPHVSGRALRHGHCHQKALLHPEDDVQVLRRLGLEVDAPDMGCCGMAGAFGFERSHYDVSMKAGERALLPAVRAVDRTTLIVADGFSCREQVRQATDRFPLHLAHVLDAALRGELGDGADRPEKQVLPPPGRRMPLEVLRGP
jgi:Fe-S oxidoreductase